MDRLIDYNTPYDKPDSEGWWWLKSIIGVSIRDEYDVTYGISCHHVLDDPSGNSKGLTIIDWVESWWMPVSQIKGTWYRAYIPVGLNAAQGGNNEI